MKWIDEVGYALSVQYAGKYCVTKFVDDIEFLEPIHIGDLVLLDAEIIKIGNTSLTHPCECIERRFDRKGQKTKLRLRYRFCCN